MNVKQEVGNGFEVSELIIQLIRNRSLNPLWLHTFGAMVDRAKNDPQYANMAGEILAGLTSSTEGLNPLFLLSTLQEATLKGGLKAVNEAVADPANLPKNVVRLTESGVDITNGAIQNPFGLLQWSLEFVRMMAEFAVSFPTAMVVQEIRREVKPEVTVRVV